MELITYMRTLPRGGRRELAEKAQTTLPYLHRIAYGYRKAAPALALRLERVTAGAVSRRDLRPDWADIWPDLQ